MSGSNNIWRLAVFCDPAVCLAERLLQLLEFVFSLLQRCLLFNSAFAESSLMSSYGFECLDFTTWQYVYIVGCLTCSGFCCLKLVADKVARSLVFDQIVQFLTGLWGFFGTKSVDNCTKILICESSVFYPTFVLTSLK